jgi:deoxyribose-phosphate aldolase
MPSPSRPLPSYIDHTLLKPDATREAVLEVAREAAEHGFAAVCIPPCYVEEVVAELEETKVAVATVIGFPFGYVDPSIRLEESRRAVNQGARELDTVLNLSWLKSGDVGRVRDDLAGWVEALRAAEEGLVLKVIVETALLTEDEKRTAAETVVAAGADYVKTSTGFAGGGATAEDVRLLASVVEGKAKIKASGGIRDVETALAMIEAGAARLGTSSGVAILRGWQEMEAGP